MAAILLAIDDVTDQHRLAESLTDGRGNVLLPQGAFLSASIRASLRRRGIAVVAVLEPQQLPEVPGPDAIQITRRLEHLFRKLDQSPSDALLRQAVTHFRLENGA